VSQSHQSFLASLQPPLGTRAFATTLPVQVTPPVSSPWAPQSSEPALPPPAPVDLDALRAEAIERGRVEGLAETARLRAQLAKLVASLAAAAAQEATTATAHIAEAATTVIAAWVGRTPSLEPIIAAWTARCGEPSTARANPADVDALRAAIGDAAVTIVPDPAIAPGDIHLRATALELEHRWADRLAELRTAIHAAIEGA
jgi:flagellar biosynthesis/type III secretory pathway protein FliH